MRKPLQLSRQLRRGNGMVNTAQMIAELICKRSVKEIQDRAHAQNDAEAMLKLGDFFMYGLKSVAKDQPKGKRFYSNAADLSSAEACTQMAKLAYELILQECDLPDGASIPAGYVSEVLWFNLLKAARLNYITPFMIDMISDARESRTSGGGILIKYMEKLFTNYKVELEAECRSEKASYRLACRTARCEIKCNDEAALLKCSQCKLVRRQMKNIELLNDI
jgi:hypothetical protein